ncbi:Small subunit (SSU) processome component [Sporothrix eucalyptigena]|uniref:Small subunit (SSU) processome component n=1 Tax=Sporothrix eucalyptigena TaxID=1812306 RepID=A0ABP0BJE2_9PEZI
MSSTKRKAPPVRITRPQMTQNAKHMAKAQINESRTSVVNVPKHQQKSKKKAAGEAIEISSDESDDDAVDEDDLMDEDEPATTDAPAVEVSQTNGHTNGITKDDKNNDDNDDEDEDGDHEPTFGDLVREHETVDVTAALSLLNPADAASNGENTPATTKTAGAAATPTLASLGHLLNAALRSGDDANLEVCFNTTTDATWVRNTIQRLDPSLAGTLLQKLAARIHRRPGRAHTLVGWVQWTLITHGGALLANQAGVTRALQELHRVLEERARGLNSLLLLKGKLDMLEAQMQMRRLQRAGDLSNSDRRTAGVATVTGRVGSKAIDSVNSLGRAGGVRGAGRRRRGGAAGGARGEIDDDEDLVTYNEDLDDEDEADISGQILVNSAGVAGESFIADSDEEALDEDDDDDSEDDEEEDGAEDDDDLEEVNDDEAGEEDEIDFDDVDDDDEDDDEDDEDDQAAAAPPPKLQKKSGGAFSKRR